MLSWSSLQAAKSPYDEYDQLDKMIVKIILESTANDPLISSVSLQSHVQEAVQSLSEMPVLSSHDQLHANISAIVAEKLYPHMSGRYCMSTEEKVALADFIERHLQSHQASSPCEAIRRILSLYLLATQLPKGLSKEEIDLAIESRPKPSFNQALSAFISAELLLSPGSSVYDAYIHACKLPILPIDNLEILEIKSWKYFCESQHLLEKLPYRIGQRIETEVAIQLIDNPKQSFGSLVHHTLHAFQKNKELALSKKTAELEKRIYLWCQQGDLLCRCVRFDLEMPLLQRILKLYCELDAQGLQLSSREFVGKVCHDYLREYPALGCYSTQLFSRITTLYKYAWYTLLSGSEEASIDRYLKWHRREMHQLIAEDKQLETLCEQFRESLPLIPFEEKLDKAPRE
jgi:hypothetical protein